MTFRRDFLAFTAGAVVAKTVLPIAAKAGTNPDAELIRVCAAFDACDQGVSIIHGTGPGCIADDDEADVASAPLRHRMQGLLDRMRDLHATTPTGIQARAHSLAQHAGHLGYSFDGDESTTVGALLLYLLRDAAAIGRSGAVVKLPPSPDAGLLGACAAYFATEAGRPVPTGLAEVGGTLECRAHEARQNAITYQQDGVVHNIAAMPARTMEGMRVKAKVLVDWDGAGSFTDDRSDFAGDRLVGSLVRDLIGGSA